MEKGYRVYNNGVDTMLLDLIDRDIETFALTRKDEDVFRTKNGDVKQIQNLHHVYEFEVLGEYIKNYFGLDGEIMNMQYFIKHPDYKITAPHQDGAYFDDNDNDILTFWIPLHEVNEETSTMFYYDWNGEREILTHDNCGINIRTRTGKTGMSQYIKTIPLEEFTPVNLKYGDCVVHNQFSVHYSNENSTDKARVAVTCIIKLNKKQNGKK
jgi:ectoine hydroxylase-related dioxygenase (phytanoyl-CoA dioxygenase family)